MLRFSFPDGFVRRTEAARGIIDEIRFVDTLARKVDPSGQRKIPAGCSLFMRGWAFNPDPPRLASAVLAIVDDVMSIDAAYGRPRPDIALTFEAPELESCGFQVIYPLNDLALGHHSVKVVTLDEGDGFYDIPYVEAFEIVSSRELFPGFRRAPDGRMKISIDTFSGLGSGAVPRGGMLPIERGNVVFVHGWAIDVENALPLRGIFAIVDDDHYVMGVHGLPRRDVALTAQLPNALLCGFTLRIATRSLRPGSHSLRVAALSHEDTYCEAPVGKIEVL